MKSKLVELNKNKSRFLLLGISALVACSATTCLPTAFGQVVQDPLTKDLATLEHRFFFHPYANDSVAKRLERLELMTLGAVQEGTEETRLKKLKESIALKDRESAKNIAKEKDSSASPASPGAKTNYPILGKLETKVLKKTFVGESIDQRLDRLEKQVFGVPAEAMSYIDRIDRLKKTTGLDAPVIASLPPAGPGGVIRNNAPNSRIWSVPHAMRTYPNADRLNKSLPPGATFRRFTNPDGSSGFVYQYRSDGTVPNLPGPDMSLIPRLDDFDSGLGAFGGIGGGAFSKVFDHMNRQMEQMLRNVPDDIGRDLLDQDEMPLPRSTAPLRKTPTKIQNLPPYLDPNSI